MCSDKIHCHSVHASNNSALPIQSATPDNVNEVGSGLQAASHSLSVPSRSPPPSKPNESKDNGRHSVPSNSEPEQSKEAIRTTLSGRRCNPRPVYDEQSDEDEDTELSSDDESESDSEDSDAEPPRSAARGRKNKRGSSHIAKCAKKNKRQCSGPSNARPAPATDADDAVNKVKYRGVTRKYAFN